MTRRKSCRNPRDDAHIFEGARSRSARRHNLLGRSIGVVVLYAVDVRKSPPDYNKAAVIARSKSAPFTPWHVDGLPPRAARTVFIVARLKPKVLELAHREAPDFH
jgi:hypothetical protein